MSSSTYICEQCGSASYEQFSRTQVRCLQCSTVSEFNTGYTPMPDFQLSVDVDLLNIENKKATPTSIAKRIINYFIDLLIISFIYAFYSSFGEQAKTEEITTKIPDSQLLILLLIYGAYYIFMEYKFGKTIGKMITKTKVISIDNSALSLLQCIGRFLCRIIPFEAVSGLFMNGNFWHDSIPRTMVVDDNNIN